MRGTIESRTRSVRALLLAACLPVAACDFNIEDPTVITETDLQTEAAMTGLMVGAVRSFDEAFNRAAMFSGLIADELIAAGSWPTWHETSKQGIIDPDAYEGDHVNIPWRMWRELHRARNDAAEAVEWMEEVLPNAQSDRRLAMASLYKGVSYAMFGELFCDFTVDGGPLLGRAEAFTRAKAALNAAVTVGTAANVDSIASMGRLALARVALEEGDLAQAAQYASQVPDGFRWWAHFPPGQANYAWSNMMSRGESTIQEPFRNTGDPRVPVVETTRTGPDTETILWDQQKYPGQDDNWIVGKWQEARLIQAEYRLSQNDVEGAVQLMNGNRAVWNLPALSTTMTEAEARAALRLETMYELFLENRRMMYMRRWNEFPAGWHTCMPIPGEERRNNPNLQ